MTWVRLQKNYWVDYKKTVAHLESQSVQVFVTVKLCIPYTRFTFLLLQVHKIHIFTVTYTHDSHFYYMYYICTKFTFLLFQIHFDISWVTFLPQYLTSTLCIWGFHIFCFVFKYAFLNHLFDLSLSTVYFRFGLKYNHVDCAV